jgi:hypothetical protein
LLRFVPELFLGVAAGLVGARGITLATEIAAIIKEWCRGSGPAWGHSSDSHNSG